MTSTTPTREEVALSPCPWCAGPARKPIMYNGTLETGCGGDHNCPGTDVLVPITAWNRRSDTQEEIKRLERDLADFKGKHERSAKAAVREAARADDAEAERDAALKENERLTKERDAFAAEANSLSIRLGDESFFLKAALSRVQVLETERDELIADIDRARANLNSTEEAVQALEGALEDIEDCNDLGWAKGRAEAALIASRDLSQASSALGRGEP